MSELEPDEPAPAYPPRVLLIDLSAVFWWKWHAAAGQPVDTAFEFAVGKVRQLSEAASYMRTLVCLDTGLSFRSEIYSLYKANRPAKDEAAVAQMKRVQAALREQGFELVGARLHEADDVIATLTRVAREKGIEVTIAGTDKDLLQLVGEGVAFLSIMSGDVLNAEAVRAKFGVGPELMRDYLALVGDTSDNIKGVKGVGAKHAARLLNQFGSVPNLIAALDQTVAGQPVVTPPAVRESLMKSLEELELARRLVSLADNAPIDAERLLSPEQPLQEEEEMPMTTSEPTTESPAAAVATLPPPTAPAPAPTATATVVAPTVAPAPRPLANTKFGKAKVSTAPDRSADKGIITGRPGIGKTHFVSTIPGVFILAIEEGLKGKSPDHTPAYFADEKDRVILPRSLTELNQAIEEFATVRNAAVDGKRPFRHLAVDGLTGIEQLVHMEAMHVEKAVHMESKEYKKIWAAAEPLMLGVQRKLDAVRATGVNVWVVAHSAETIDAALTGEVYRKWDLLLKGSGDTALHARNLWRGWANHIFFIDWTTKVKKGDKATRTTAEYKARVMYTRESATHFAKTRARLPVSIPCTWEDLAKAMAAGSIATEPKLRAEVEALLPKLGEEDRATIETDLVSAEGANRIAAILSRAQGMIAIATEATSAAESEQESEQETAA